MHIVATGLNALRYRYIGGDYVHRMLKKSATRVKRPSV